MLVKQLIYVLLLQHLVVQLSFVCGIRLHMLLFESLWMLQRYSSVTFENKRFSTSNAGSMVVKLFDSLVQLIYSGV